MSLLKKLLRFIPDKLYLQLMYKHHIGKFINFNSPSTFNEKLQWLKLYDKKAAYTYLVDKYKAKKIVADAIGEEHIIRTYGVWDAPEKIDFDMLPNSFVLKWNHDSGSVVICRDKKSFNKDDALAKLQAGKYRSGFWYGREWPYKDVIPCVIAEEFIEGADGDLPDFKFMCFNGEVKCSFVCTKRFSNEGLHVTFYDRDWQRLPFARKYPTERQDIAKPEHYEEMVALAEKLSRNIPFVRVDFYDVNGKIYFGEMTFFPGSGFEKFNPPEWDEKIGDWLTLPGNE